ncbi:indolepyruvate oxidoreductase subunit beta [bacterium]|nr:indolepyruvate oxidoreductase subunit beta [bacterium]
MEKPIKNVIIVGTGGQGVILASEILCDVALECGYDTKKSEIHGMAQRGGVVSSHVRYGAKVASPLIAEGTADILLSFELAEAARWIPFIKSDGRVVTSTQKIVPPLVSTGIATYPDQVEEVLKTYSKNPIIVDALSIAHELGNPRLVNTILLAIISDLLDLSEDAWKKVVSNRVPPKFRELNMKAFDRGRQLSC